jgi:hypothetical protein
VSWVRRTVGLDGIDLLIHAGVTFSVMAIGSSLWSHGDAEIMLATVSCLSFVALGVRRHRALRNLPPETTGELAAERIAELEARVAELEQGEFRMHELEERLDFAERLLAQAREPERLG